MLLRLTLILIMVLPQWTPAGVPTVPRACVAEACCCVVERVTCCGERIVEVVCRRSGDACTCASEPDRERHAPITPALAGTVDHLLLASLSRPTPVALGGGATAARMIRFAPLARSAGRVRALLCIWRT